MPVTQFPDEWLAQSVEGLTPERLQELRGKAESGRTLWECVVAEKLATDAEIVDKLSHRFRLKIADVTKIDPSAQNAVPEQLARRHHILPLRLTDSYLEIGTANPLDLDAEKALAFNTAREIRLFLLAPSKINEKLDEMYKSGKALDKLLEGMGDSDILTTLKDAAPEEISEADASQKPVVRLVDMIISEGILSRASDIHVEPEEGGVAVRYRIDGVLRQVMKIPRQAGLPLISRIKIMSSLDIADRLRPQDGRARVAVNGQPIDLRVSTLPAALGEKVVIRILDSRATVKSLDSLGLNTNETEGIRRLLENHEGIILVTGPTGSRNGTDRRAGVPHRAPRAVDAAHERRRQRGHPARGHRRRGLQDRRGAAGRRGAAADAQTVPYLQGSVDGGARRPSQEVDPEGDAAVSRGGLSRLRDDGIPRPFRDHRGPDGVGRGGAADRGGGNRRAHRRGGAAFRNEGSVGLGAAARAARRIHARRIDLRRGHPGGGRAPDRRGGRVAPLGRRGEGAVRVATGRRHGLHGAGAQRRPRGADDALRAAGGARAAARLRAERVAGAQGDAGGRRGQSAQGREGPARARRLHRLRGARRRAGARSGRSGGSGHHRARPQHAWPRRLRRVVPPALAARDRGHPGHRPHGEERRRQRSAGVRAGRGRLPHEAVPGAGALGTVGGSAGPPSLIRDFRTSLLH